MAVVRLAADRDEELARLDRTAVGRDARERGARAETHELAARRPQHVDQLETGIGGETAGRRAHPARLASAARTSSRSSRWCFTVPTI